MVKKYFKEISFKKNKTVIQETYMACMNDQRKYFENLEKSISLLQIFNHLNEFRKKQEIRKTVDFIDEKIIRKFGEISDAQLHNSQYETVAVSWLNSAYPMVLKNFLF